MADYFKSVEEAARFSPAKGTKADLFAGSRLFVGLNCFEPGQSQAVHAHPGADKFYFVAAGKARMTVGNETREVGAGTVVWAPADLPHGVVAALERTVMLVAIAPPPGRSAGGEERHPGSAVDRPGCPTATDPDTPRRAGRTRHPTSGGPRRRSGPALPETGDHPRGA